jgi:multisubunit Na+/H+ antiporter MnhE subunit
MLTSQHFWVGFIVALIAMYVYHKYQMKKAGA